MAVRIVTWIARIAGAGTMFLGWLFLVFHVDIIVVHVALGLAFAVSLAALGLGLISSPDRGKLGALGLVYALVMTAFGAVQAQLLIGSLHWLIQVAHLLVGIGALLLVQIMSAGYRRIPIAALPQEGTVQAVRQ